MSRKYKNIIKIRSKNEGPQRVEEISREISKNSTPFFNAIEYEDIDKEFNRWTKEDLYITFEGKEIPTFSLFSNQRFSEFLQSWEEVDEKKNLILNFKTVTRENNPKPGTIFGNIKNIPGDFSILLKRVEALDKANRKYYIDYRIKQPIAVDFMYTVGIVTNKYELLNDFNQIINDKFKSINAYIIVNGHYLPMKLNDIFDESEYNIDNRTYYSQSYSITVMGYIIPKNSFIVEEKPIIKYMGFEGEINNKSYAEIEELPCHLKDESLKFDFQPINLKINLEKCDLNYKFIIDTSFQIKNIILTNIRSFKFFVNDKEIDILEGLKIKNGSEIKVKNIIREKNFEKSILFFEGFNYEMPLKKEYIKEITEIIIN